MRGLRLAGDNLYGAPVSICWSSKSRSTIEADGICWHSLVPSTALVREDILLVTIL